jgi:hypothetical protein
MQPKIQRRSALDTVLLPSAPMAKILLRGRLAHRSDGFWGSLSATIYRTDIGIFFHQNEAPIWGPSHAGQRAKVRIIAVNEPRIQFECCVHIPLFATYSSAKASIIRRQPSSDTAATYRTSGENAKSSSR